MDNILKIHTDGGARGNPGPGGIGAVAYSEDKKVVFELSKFLGITTNNRAEYHAVIEALKKARELGYDVIELRSDSELVVRQLNREYKVKNADLVPLFLEVYNLTTCFKKVKFFHIRREHNKEADALANQAMDRGIKDSPFLPHNFVQ